MKKTFCSKSNMLASLLTFLLLSAPAFASEADLVVPNIHKLSPTGYNLLLFGLLISVVGVIFGFIEFLRVKKLSVHECMANVGNTIFETCKTYLVQQGKFLIVLEILIGICIAYYFGALADMGWKQRDTFPLFLAWDSAAQVHSHPSRKTHSRYYSN